MAAHVVHEAYWRIRRRSTVVHFAIAFLMTALLATVLAAKGVVGLPAEIGYGLVALSAILLVVALVMHPLPGVPPRDVR
jgi:uncharacterized membrane protein YtjA (UPF0391 family)